MAKHVRLVSSRDEGKYKTRSALLQVARSRPHACLVVFRDDNNRIHVVGTFQNRLEMMGAIEAAKLETWDSP